MESRKIIVIDPEIEKLLINIYDAALKFSGMQMRGWINSIMQEVKEEEIR
jgi:hypothetical protein